MNPICPFCRREMLPGYIQSRDTLFWTPRRRKLGPFVIAAPLLQKEAVRLTCRDDGIYGACAAAYRCPVCRKVLIDESAAD